MPIILEHTTHATDDARALVEELEAELSEDYAPEHRHGLSLDQIFRPNIAFFVARENGDPVGCGGIAFDDGFAEVKRMYVRRSARGHGVAQAVLARLEQEARAKGYKRMTLETGDTLFTAMRLYERAGFKPCAAFGHYAKLPDNRIAHSRFFEKLLD